MEDITNVSRQCMSFEDRAEAGKVCSIARPVKLQAGCSAAFNESFDELMFEVLGGEPQVVPSPSPSLATFPSAIEAGLQIPILITQSFKFLQQLRQRLMTKLQRGIQYDMKKHQILGQGA